VKKLTHEQLLARQETRRQKSRIPICAILDDVRSAENVGSIFRTADAVGLEKLWLCGITCSPPNPLLRKTALDAEDHVPWEYRKDISSLIIELKKKGYQIVVLEQTDQSIPVQSFMPKGPVCLIVGHEVTGVREDVVALADAAVEIDMDGVKNSLNVAVAFGVAVYCMKNILRF